MIGLDELPRLAGLTKKDIDSLQAARGHWSASLGSTAITTYTTGLKPEVAAAFVRVGLTEDEVALCEAWAPLATPVGVCDECRAAKWLMDRMPVPDKLGVMDAERFWECVGLYTDGHLAFLWDAMRFRERPAQETAFGRVMKKVADHWMHFALDHWPDEKGLVRALQRQQARHAKKGETPKVGLAALWRLFGDLERVRHQWEYVWPENPEDLYDRLGELKGAVEINCWLRDDEVLLGLLKEARVEDSCSDCGLFSRDAFSWAFGGGAYCPRCVPKMWKEKGAKGDGGPVWPESGGAIDRWADRHGMMTDEAVEFVKGRQAGFEPGKKKPCPFVSQCDTRCAKDQKSGVRGFPLGSSHYETSCHKFREIKWCTENGKTPAEFKEAEEARWAQQSKELQAEARAHKRAAKKAPVEKPAEKADVPAAKQAEPAAQDANKQLSLL